MNDTILTLALKVLLALFDNTPAVVWFLLSVVAIWALAQLARYVAELVKVCK